MMALQRISCLRYCGIFRSFDWPDDLPEFSRFNLIYGWNATGKTTLSWVLRHLEKRTIPQGEVKLKLTNGEFEGKEFPNRNVCARVFNRDFVNENVFAKTLGCCRRSHHFGVMICEGSLTLPFGAPMYAGHLAH